MAERARSSKALIFPCDAFLFFDSYAAIELEIEPWMLETYAVAYASDGEVIELNRNGHTIEAHPSGRFDPAALRHALMEFLNWAEEPERLRGADPGTLATSELWAVCSEGRLETLPPGWRGPR